MSEPTAAGETTRTLVVEREFAHPPEKLWRALTESTLLAEWLMGNDFAPIAGRTFRFQAGAMPNWDGAIDCQVRAVEPITRLSYTWNALGLHSVVLWTLTPTAAGTHLRMEQSGFRPDQDTAYKGATHGWQRFLGALERVLGEEKQ
jgi:uncharacterized protein YndB with AHSA1/START domain